MRTVKKYFLVFIILSLIIILSSSAFALTCSVKFEYCDASAGELSVFQISNLTNAHASNDSSYLYNVCCKEADSTLGKVCPADPLSDPSAVALRLSATSNAHAEENDYINYDTKVCLSSTSISGGNPQKVRCYLNPTGNSCGSDACLATISNFTNAHVAYCYGPGNYSYKVCCGIVSSSITKAYWADMAGNKITQADSGDDVVLVAEGTNAEGFQVNFSVWELISGRFDGNCLTGKLPSEFQAVFAENKAIYVWKNITYCDEGGTNDGYKFQAYLTSDKTTYKNTSLALMVNKQQNNTPPVAVISSPEFGSIHPSGTPINFISGSYDVDDNITNYLWNISDGKTLKGKSNTSSYSTGGPKTITLTVTDSHGLQNTATARILINSSADDPPLAIISSPVNNAVIGKENTKVLFNGSLSVDDNKTLDKLLFSWYFCDGERRENVRGDKGGAIIYKDFKQAGDCWVILKVDDGDPVDNTTAAFRVGVQEETGKIDNNAVIFLIVIVIIAVFIYLLTKRKKKIKIKEIKGKRKVRSLKTLATKTLTKKKVIKKEKAKRILKKREKKRGKNDR